MHKILFSFIILAGFLASCQEETPEISDGPENQSIDSLIANSPEDVSLLVKRGNERLVNYQLELAIQDATKAFRLDSNNFDARLLYANVMNNKVGRTVQDIYTAQRHFNVLLKEQPENIPSLIGLASTYTFQQDFTNSFKYINEALRIDPTYRDAYIMKGTNYRLLNKPDLMKSSYETAIQQDPTFHEAYTILGSIYLQEENPICMEYYTTARELQPNSAEAKYAEAYAKQHFGNDDVINEAVGMYHELSQDTSKYYSSQAFFQLGHIKQFVKNDLDSAIYYYSNATYVFPNFVEAFHNIGVCYADLGDKSRAMKNFGKALAINPDYELSRQEADKIKF